MKPPFISRLRIKNYKSIGRCDLSLPPLGFLVGPNGSGKSNLLDALAFVSEALNTTLDHSIRDRGGFVDIVRRHHPDYHPFIPRIRIELEYFLSETGQKGIYSFSFTGTSEGFGLTDEKCLVEDSDGATNYYTILNGEIKDSNIKVAPAVQQDRLYLVSASGLPEFRHVYDALSSIRVHNVNPALAALFQTPDVGKYLSADGDNLASIFRSLSENEKEAVMRYFFGIIPDVSDVKHKVLGNMETLEFQSNLTPIHVEHFLASSMSDGTLRALATLVAVFQKREVSSLVGIEEPEIALHPAASAVLLAALREASQKTQILVSSHSPDLLDNPDIDPNSIFAVEKEEGITRIAGVDEASLQTLKDKLFTPGELLRMNQLSPSRSSSNTNSSEVLESNAG